jgi:hypothetical protein
VFKVHGQFRAEVYVSDVPNDAWPTGVDIRERSVHRRAAEAEDSAEGLVDSDDEGED